MSDPALLSLVEARKVPPGELLQACRARIEQWQPRLNAFLEVEENPAPGVPLAHKDMFYRAGRVATCGSKILRNWVVGDTSAALERLDAADYAQLGRLNMSEFAYGPTGHNEHFGDCRNPWNPDYIAGGSSSVSGLKTTWGRVSRHGAMPLSHSASASERAMMRQSSPRRDRR